MRNSGIGTAVRIGALALMMLVTLLCAPVALPQAAPLAGRTGESAMFTLYTKAFSTGGEIPKEFTCSGENRSPALNWDGAPQGTQSFALIADDPDAPSGTFTHWVIYNIPAVSKGFARDVPRSERLDDGTLQGQNDFQRIGYGGPCPPPGTPHRYFFKLYALDARLSLEPGATRQQLDSTMKEHVLAQAEIMGTFKR